MADYRISKIDAARRQLECAIRIYFNAGDSISIHTLCAASRNVLLDLCNARGLTSALLREELLKHYVKPEHVKQVRDRYRQAENFFKHADQDPDGLLSFNPEGSEYFIFEATEAYQLLTGESTPHMLSFRTWWIAHNTFMHALLPEEAKNAFMKFPYKPDQRLLFFNESLPMWHSGAR